MFYLLKGYYRFGGLGPRARKDFRAEAPNGLGFKVSGAVEEPLCNTARQAWQNPRFM